MNFCRGQILSDRGVTSCVNYGAGEPLQRESSPDYGNTASNAAEDDVGAAPRGRQLNCLLAGGSCLTRASLCRGNLMITGRAYGA